MMLETPNRKKQAQDLHSSEGLVVGNFLPHLLFTRNKVQNQLQSLPISLILNFWFHYKKSSWMRNTSREIQLVMFVVDETQIRKHLWRYLIVPPPTHAPIDYGTGLCYWTLEAYHHSLAWRTWSTGMRTIWQAWARRMYLLHGILISFTLHINEMDHWSFKEWQKIDRD